MSNLAHEQNFLDALVDRLHWHMEEGATTSDRAFNRVAAEWLGYDLDTSAESDAFVDGGGDRGVDFWYASDVGFEVFQAKSHDLSPQGKLDLSTFDSEGIRNLHSVLAFLTDETAAAVGNRALIAFKRQWDDALASRRLDDEQQVLVCGLNLVLLGDGLTGQAEAEYGAFVASLAREWTVGRVSVEFRSKVYCIDDLLGARWREENREWRDAGGHKRDSIELHPKDKTDCIIQSKSVVFYCRAFDLVTAFNQFGYQVFEPNVRCNINQSKVNAAIRESAMHANSRREFELLNNGLTIVCHGYTKPSVNKPVFRVIEPGVVNGLQTVMALRDAYGKLETQDEKQDFERNCFVLVRLLQENAVSDVSRVVRATNTQNPMQPRNLRSNNSEQVHYERLFASLGWFYERKDGAWAAFAADPKRWRTLPGKTRQDFCSGKRVRKVDNEILAQTWLSLIGFSNEAVHDKRFLFESDRLYNLVFLHRTKQHGSAYGYRLGDIPDEDRIQTAPNPSMMLASYLAHRFALKVPLTAAENRQVCCKRLQLDQDKLSREDVDRELSKDAGFLIEQVLNGMSYVFVDTFGYILFKALGENSQECGKQLLGTNTLRLLSQDFAIDTAKDKARAGDFEPDDLLPVMWCVFVHVISELVGGAWKDSYRNARSRSQFNHSQETRMRIVESVDALDKYTLQEQFTRLWAAGMKPGTGLFGYVRSILTV